MRKLFSLILVVALGFGGWFFFIRETSSTDEQFLKAVSSGLEARWTYQEENPLTLDNQNDVLLTSARLELDKIQSFSSKTFENAELGQLANDYIVAVQSQIESLESSRFAFGIFNGSALDRLVIVSQLVNDYNLQVSEANTTNLKSMALQGQAVIKTRELMSNLPIGQANDQIASLFESFTNGQFGSNNESFFTFLQDNLNTDTLRETVNNFFGGIINHFRPSETNYDLRDFAL